MKVAVFGLGYVGTVTAAGLAHSGHTVVGVDVDATKVAAINAGESPVVEPGIAELMESAVQAGRLHATSSAVEAVEHADLSLICVGTPSGSLGSTDLSYVEKVLAEIRHAMSVVAPPASGFHAVVVRSTVPPGTVDTVVAPAFAEAVPGWEVGAAMCPEFLREGVSVKDFFAPPFVVVGTADERAAAAVAELFSFLDIETRHVATTTAESLKYACNAFHATKVSFANELSRVFRGFGVDSREVMEIFCEDTKLNIAPTYLRPGFAYGGSCLPKDLRALLQMARANGVDAPLLDGTVLTNELIIRDVVERVIATGLRHVALLGLSFKADTDDLRESPNVELAERLVGKGFDVRVYDPIVNPDRLVGANRRHVETRLPHLNRLLACTPEAALEGAEVVLVSASGEGITDALRAAAPAHVIDLCGRLDHEVEELPGYSGVGW
ncbi:nucleotide sugar dehydrogenase [Nocardioides sp. MAH-18]|uniref:UDP-glucose 6-dehydrogenase n=1 Tax=Nocardioides agri TaxID=2682843 RepID=A0A6L6XP80_9ACTN|nr:MULTISPECIES: UDP-glucose/GDP-mannose dehydrogenase family protein [unclassified Nocardioides]MBA2954212.1 UDP-glucose/GDP-mannose dehydrogenase family protein [Nocardioides sp. CGMCC 1.13656]MVQ49074.1 nucleotide sugar dehydrogenase [Nocardioides sp. MAH-18]